MKPKFLFLPILCAVAVMPVIAQVNFNSSNLPIVIIDTKGGKIVNEPKIAANMGIIFNGKGNRNNITDDYNAYNGNIAIEIRGSSTQSYPKQSYAFETRDSAGGNLNVSLLGMPKENDWILYGPYADKSLLRNVLIYKLANDMGRYASRTKFVELVINNDYRGIYILMEKIKKDKNRVDVITLNPADSTGDQLTGGYIIKIDKTEGASNEGWNSSFPPYTGAWQRILYQYHYPQPDEITQKQKNYIIEFIYSFESKMYSNNYNNPIKGYYDYIDIDSFVDYMICTEYSRNVDGYRLSAFMYKDRKDKDDRLKMGPIWDYNFAFGNADYYNAWKTDGWHLYLAANDYKNDSFQIPFWWKKLMTDPVFNNRLAYRWNELKDKLLNYNKMNASIDSLYNLIQEAKTRNFNQWNVIGVYVWPNYYVGSTYELEVNYLKTWIQYRFNWMDGFIPDNPSHVSWLPQKTSVAVETGRQTLIGISEFFDSFQSVDSISFISSSDSLIVTKQNDAVEILCSTSGRYYFKGVAWKNNMIVDVSPKYFCDGITNVDFIIAYPGNFSLSQNYPNPFNPATTIEYKIKNSEFVSLMVYDILGGEIATLVKKVQTPGSYQIEFNIATTPAGHALPGGVYFYTLLCGDKFRETRKMVLLK